MCRSHIGNVEHGHGGRLLESISAAVDREGREGGKSYDEIFSQVRSFSLYNLIIDLKFCFV